MGAASRASPAGSCGRGGAPGGSETERSGAPPAGSETEGSGVVLQGDSGGPVPVLAPPASVDGLVAPLLRLPEQEVRDDSPVIAAPLQFP
jgi:hypothetical protein